MTRQYCSFALGTQLYGVDVEHVQEVLSAQAMTAVPLAPAAVRGLINLRGEIVPAIDLRVRFGLPVLGVDRAPSNVVLRTREGPISLLVDRIGDVLALADAQLEPPPALGDVVGGVAISSRARALLTGVYQLADALLLVVDPGALIDLRDPNAATVPPTTPATKERA